MSQRKPRSSALEPFDIDALMGASSMSGMLSFLDVPARKPSIVPKPTPYGRTIHTPMDDTSIPYGRSDHTPAITPPASVVKKTPKPVRAKSVQDAHTMGEQLVYETLWTFGGSDNGVVAPYKEVSGGYNRLASKTGLSDKAVMRNLRSLEEKLAITRISLEEKETCTPRVYRVFSYKEILQRRRAAGLEWVIRSGHGVAFAPVDVTTIPCGRNDHTPMDATSIDPMDTAPIPPVDVPSTHIEKKREIEQTTSTVHLLLQAQLPTFDGAAVEKLWEDCRQRVPDVTAEEVSWLFSQKIRSSQARGVESPNGFLISAVSRSCTPAAVAAIRQGREVAVEPDSPVSPAEEIARLEAMLDAYPNHPQAGDWRKTMDALKS
jgi:hypothetical protein